MKLKTTIYTVVGLCLCALLSVFFFSSCENTQKTDTLSETEQLSQQYSDFLEKHPFRTTMSLSKEGRQAKGITS